MAQRKSKSGRKTQVREHFGAREPMVREFPPYEPPKLTPKRLRRTAFILGLFWTLFAGGIVGFSLCTCHAACRNGPSPLGNSRNRQVESGLSHRKISKESEHARRSNSSHPVTFFVAMVTRVSATSAR